MTEHTYSDLDCVACGIRFVIPDSLWDTASRTRNDKNPVKFYCPYGHEMVVGADLPDEKPIEDTKPNNVIPLRLVKDD